MKRSLIGLSLLLLVELAIAFSPLAEGTEGTRQDMVGDIVWTAIFVTVPLIIVLTIMWLVRRGKPRGA